MKWLRNARTLFSQPALVPEYLRFRLAKAKYPGEVVRYFPEDRLEIGGLSGFSEFHSCAQFFSDAERRFLAGFDFGEGPMLDVGGNLGIFSLLLARRFPDREIHAFEPNPTTFESMRANFARNGCPQAHAHALAVAASDGEISFQADPTYRATTHIVLGDQATLSTKDDLPVIRVSCVTLDSFLASLKIERISLLKVDVEGYEELVFRGGERFLTSGFVKVIYYEICPRITSLAGFAPEAASRRLIEYGYRLYVLRDDGTLQPADPARIAEATLENWVALRD